ncbi:MAG TPA: hypothetical protein VKA46_13105 [Gemmataceae bacterium]|nr:hypothetical protein [Gemmataceae bacterium]
MVGRIEQAFPGLRGTAYQVTSPQDDTYNCIAWAAGDTTDWWWPDEPNNPESAYWPPDVPRVETLEAFREAFANLGYVVCNDDQFEGGYEKVALFALAGEPKHVARQLPNGRWTSKLGPMEDVEHALHDLTRMVYGSVVLVMKRPLSAAEKGEVDRAP